MLQISRDDDFAIEYCVAMLWWLASIGLKILSRLFFWLFLDKWVDEGVLSISPDDDFAFEYSSHAVTLTKILGSML